MPQSQVPGLLDVLKTLLRGHGYRYGDIAKVLGVGERTVKRYLRGENLTLAILERMCALAGIQLSELTELAQKEVERKPNTLSLAQEAALSKNPFAGFVFRLLRYGWTSQEVQEEFALDEASLVTCLLFLDHLELIDLLPNNRTRLRTARVIEWLPGGPFRRAFDSTAKHSFAEMDYLEPDAVWALKTVKLSPASTEELKQLIAEFSAAVMHLGERDRRLPRDAAKWFSVLSAVRKVDPRRLQEDPPRF